MDAKELRIGNYFRRIYGHGYEDIVEASIHDIVDINTKPWNEHVFFDGIPLTEAWFLKFGISKYSQKDYILKDTGFNITDYNDGKGWRLTIEDCDKSKELKYVHQLQNLYFALTSEELTIKQ